MAQSIETRFKPPGGYENDPPLKWDRVDHGKKALSAWNRRLLFWFLIVAVPWLMVLTHR